MSNAWSDLIFWEKVCKELEAQTGIKANKTKEVLDEMKRKIRRQSKNYRFSPDEIVFRQEIFDSAMFKYPLPEYIKTFEEAEEYFDEYERLYYKPSAYDCTGQLFTGYHKIFRKPDGRFWCYHGIDRDV